MALDAVSIFAEGTVEEQAQELIDCLIKSKPEEDHEKFLERYQARLHPDGKNINEDTQLQGQVFTSILKDTNDMKLGTDREIEGYFNLLLSHILSLFATSSEELSQNITYLLTLLSTRRSTEHLLIQYRILSNTFNGLPKDSPLRLDVFSALIKLASEHSHQNTLQVSQPLVKRWMKEWNVTPEKKSSFLKSLSDMMLKDEQENEAYGYLLQHLQILPTSSPAARDAAIQSIAGALRIQSVFNFDELLKLEAVAALGDHGLLQALKILTNGSVQEYTSWAGPNESILNEFGIETEALLSKMRALCLASLASSNVGRDVSYAQISEALNVSESNVESCVINVVHSGLVSGKLSQSRRTFHVMRSSLRSFERSEWEVLEARLLAWKNGLTSVLDVVSAAQQVPPSKATASVAIST